jgi:hypothetical protein
VYSHHRAPSAIQHHGMTHCLYVLTANLFASCFALRNPSTASRQDSATSVYANTPFSPIPCPIFLSDFFFYPLSDETTRSKPLLPIYLLICQTHSTHRMSSSLNARTCVLHEKSDKPFLEYLHQTIRSFQVYTATHMEPALTFPRLCSLPRPRSRSDEQRARVFLWGWIC